MDPTTREDKCLESVSEIAPRRVTTERRRELLQIAAGIVDQIERKTERHEWRTLRRIIDLLEGDWGD